MFVPAVCVHGSQEKGFQGPGGSNNRQAVDVGVDMYGAALYCCTSIYQSQLFVYGSNSTNAL